MRDLTETLTTIALSVLLIGATYSLLGAWLVSLINQAFTLTVP